MSAQQLRPLHDLDVERLQGRTSLKWHAYPDDVLPLWVAEMDVELAPAIAEALVAAVNRSDTGYPVEATYAAAMAEYASARWDWQFDPANARLVTDVMIGITDVLDLITDPGSPVVVNSPVYPPFYQFIRHVRRVPVEAPLGTDHRIDLTMLESVFAGLPPGVRAAYLVCNPQNPTGTSHTPDELTAALTLAEAYGVRVIADEIHAPIRYPDGAHTPVLSLPAGNRAFSLMSASKAFNLPGIKAGLAVAGSEAGDELRALTEIVSHGASHLGVIAHTTALREGGPWLDSLITDLDANRRLLADLLAAHLPEIRYRMPEATYLAWLECRALGLGDDPAAVFLERGRVAFAAGGPFGTGGEGHVRFNLGTAPSIIEEAVRRMAASV